MNENTVSSISDLVFMKRKNLFQVPDVIIYHPGHFPELNEQLCSFYKKYKAEKIMIPNVYNSFLKCNEYDYYAPLLVDKGIEQNILSPIQVTENVQGVEDVIKSAFLVLNETEYVNILLAGKSFFSRRFYMLASLYANKDKQLDILPLEDHRGITPLKWNETEKGRLRVLNELEQYGKIANRHFQL